MCIYKHQVGDNDGILYTKYLTSWPVQPYAGCKFATLYWRKLTAADLIYPVTSLSVQCLSTQDDKTVANQFHVEPYAPRNTDAPWSKMHSWGVRGLGYEPKQRKNCLLLLKFLCRAEDGSNQSLLNDEKYFEHKVKTLERSPLDEWAYIAMPPTVIWILQGKKHHKMTLMLSYSPRWCGPMQWFIRRNELWPSTLMDYATICRSTAWCWRTRPTKMNQNTLLVLHISCASEIAQDGQAQNKERNEKYPNS